MQMAVLTAICMLLPQGCATKGIDRESIFAWGSGVVNVESVGQCVADRVAISGLPVDYVRCHGMIRVMTREQGCLLARTLPARSKPRAVVMWSLIPRTNELNRFIGMKREEVVGTIGRPDLDSTNEWRYFVLGDLEPETGDPGRVADFGPIPWDLFFSDGDVVTNTVVDWEYVMPSNNAPVRGWWESRVGPERDQVGGDFAVLLGDGVRNVDEVLERANRASNVLPSDEYPFGDGILSALSWEQACDAYRSPLATDEMKLRILDALVLWERLFYDRWVNISQEVLVKRLGPPKKKEVKVRIGMQVFYYGNETRGVGFLCDNSGIVRRIVLCTEDEVSEDHFPKGAYDAVNRVETVDKFRQFVRSIPFHKGGSRLHE